MGKGNYQQERNQEAKQAVRGLRIAAATVGTLVGRLDDVEAPVVLVLVLALIGVLVLVLVLVTLVVVLVLVVGRGGGGGGVGRGVGGWCVNPRYAEVHDWYMLIRPFLSSFLIGNFCGL